MYFLEFSSIDEYPFHVQRKRNENPFKKILIEINLKYKFLNWNLNACM